MEYHGYPNCILHLAAKGLTHAEVGFNDVLLSLDRGDDDIVLGSGHGGVRTLVVSLFFEDLSEQACSAGPRYRSGTIY
jgi:hypothetical protein